VYAKPAAAVETCTPAPKVSEPEQLAVAGQQTPSAAMFPLFLSYTHSWPGAAVGLPGDPGQFAVGGPPAGMRLGAGALANGTEKEKAVVPIWSAAVA
jgi:hypothetical protein